jgi:hypothetical protein
MTTRNLLTPTGPRHAILSRRAAAHRRGLAADAGVEALPEEAAPAEKAALAEAALIREVLTAEVRTEEALIETVQIKEALIAPPPEEAPPEVERGGGREWVAYAEWMNDTDVPVTSFRATWIVPPAPATGDQQTIFLFNGMQHHGTPCAILQPVLLWTREDQCWSVASCYVECGTEVTPEDGGEPFDLLGKELRTEPIAVKPGQTLVGAIRMTGRWENNQCDYVCEFEGIEGTRLHALCIEQLTQCVVTLEAYSIDACTDYPDCEKTTFSRIVVETGGLDLDEDGAPLIVNPVFEWIPQSLITNCGQKCVIVKDSSSDGEVDVYYR